MGNLFDRLQATMFGTVANNMGYDATWSPAGGGPVQTARVLYSGPTEKHKLMDAEYFRDAIWLEYLQGSFIGLKESVDAGGTEIVNIAGIGQFLVASFEKLFDGKNYKARIKRSD